jgi:nitrogen fixation protein FixH
MTTTTPHARRRRFTGWQILGIVVAVIFLVAALAAIAFVVLFMVAMASWGSNK